MLRGYANRGSADKSYIGAISELLMHYPKDVAEACADPFHGVVRDTKFMPTPSDIINWCEKRVRPLFEEADREVRVSVQLVKTDDWRNQEVSERLKQLGRAWLDRSDPVAAQLSGQKNTAKLAAEARKRLEDEYGIDLVDAVPEAQ